MEGDDTPSLVSPVYRAQVLAPLQEAPIPALRSGLNLPYNHIVNLISITDILRSHSTSTNDLVFPTLDRTLNKNNLLNFISRPFTSSLTFFYAHFSSRRPRFKSQFATASTRASTEHCASFLFIFEASTALQCAFCNLPQF